MITVKEPKKAIRNHRKEKDQILCLDVPAKPNSTERPIINKIPLVITISPQGLSRSENSELSHSSARITRLITKAITPRSGKPPQMGIVFFERLKFLTSDKLSVLSRKGFPRFLFAFPA
jgi:hypothetical protein